MNEKDSLMGLAVCGGKPAFVDELHVGRPNIGDADRLINRIHGILDRRWLTNNGPLVLELEDRLSDMLNVSDCIAMCNATVALEVAIRALGLTGEVIVPSFTFIATAHALQWQEITPIFCDIDRKTHCLDPHLVERKVTPRTSGILGVHIWGRACDVRALTEIAADHKLKLLFDAAHAFGCSHKGTMIGNFGDAEVFSFHATKFVNSFEGGAIVTNDHALASKMRLMRNFGFAGFDNVVDIGTNGKMTEVAAAMALTSLDAMDDFVEFNVRNYKEYRAGLNELPGIGLIEYDNQERNNYQYIVLEIDDRLAGLNRDDLIKILHAERVLARRYFFPGCHRMEPYRSLFPQAGLSLPETEALTDRVMLLPTGTAVSVAAIRTICSIIRTAIAHAPAVREQLYRYRVLA